NRKLLACGATINEMNCVRRHLSRIKGGRLAAAIHPARIINLLISDVPGDDPINIASGPTVQDTTSVEDALAIIERYNIELPKSAREHLDRQRGAAKACAVALDVAGRSKSGFEGGAREVLEDCASQASRPFSLKGVNIE
ncbi:DUF4147 domain-containing protein, partial [Rhodobacteraceae bacterium RKSG542]|uniref:DUF4147 domain-containing protein n=1 Tax=Pseudovibrio flavus TaxID=2529854 RepID=UPI0012BC8262